jgi:DNA-binding SARP family transcriptional activator
MEFRILGPIEVLDGPRRLRVPAGRGGALLAVLVLHAGEAVLTDRLIDDLWGEQPPRTASTALQGLVSKLRKELGPASIETVGDAYRLNADNIDSEKFKRLLEQARAAEPEERAQLLHEAAALWRGPPLSDFAYEPFAQHAIAELEELRLTALESRVDADLSLGRTGLVAEIDALVKEHPFRERLRALQMLALYREGRQAEALAAYRSARATLAEEIGIDLGPGLRDLHEKILRQDASLDQPRTPAGMGTWLPGERQVALSLALAEVHLVLGRFGQAQEMLRNIIEAGDELAARAARLEHARIQFIIGPDPVPLSKIEDEARAAAHFFRADDAGSARATFLLGCVRMREGRMIDAEAAFRDSMARADRAGHMRERLAARWMVGEVLVNGPTPVSDAKQEVEQLAADLDMEIPGLLLHRAVLSAMEGRFDDARELVNRSRALTMEEMRAPRLLVFVEAASASVELLAGDVHAAEKATHNRLEIAMRGEEQENIAQAAGWLSLMRRRLGLDAAETAALSASRAPFGVPGRAISLGASGSAREAADLVPEEMPNLRADMLLERAVELRARDDEAGAKMAESKAARLYRLKGNIVSAERLVPTALAPV